MACELKKRCASLCMIVAVVLYWCSDDSNIGDDDHDNGDDEGDTAADKDDMDVIPYN